MSDSANGSASPQNKVSLVGLGLSPDHLLPAARQRVEHAQVVVAGRGVLERLHHCAPEGAEAMPITAPLEDVFATIRQRLDRGLRVVAVASGDPLFFGLGRRLLDALGPDRVDVLPGLTTLQVAAAKLKTPWDDIRAVSLHGRGGSEDVLAALAFTPRVAAFTDATNTPQKLGQTLLERGFDGCVRMTVCEDLHLPTERIRAMSPGQAATLEDVSPLNLVLLETQGEAEVRLRLGIPDSELATDGNHTKGMVRAAVVAGLDLAPRHTLWDLGAGCGTVSVACASQLPQGRVVAVERKPHRLELICRNVRRTRAFHVHVVEGDVADPTLMAGLPDPDRIFFGGGLGGNRAESTLEIACQRLPKGGVLVVSAVLLSTLEVARAAMARLGLKVAVTQLSHAASAPLAGDVRLVAESPVFLQKGTKP